MADKSHSGDGVPKKKENDTTNQPNPEPKASDAPIAGSRPEPNFAPSERHNCGKKYKRIKEEIKFWFEIAGIIAGIGVLYLFWKQYGEMVKATNATEKQLDEMRVSRNLDERAWVLANGIERTVDVVNGIPKDWVFSINIKNTGKTPAIGVGAVCNWTTGTNNIPKFDNKPLPPVNSGLLPPDAVIQSSTSPIPVSVINSINNGNSIYCFGTIWYNDIFRKPHWSQFCFRYDVGDLSKGHFAAFHNSCDDVETNQTN